MMDFEITHRSGKISVIADALSRIPISMKLDKTVGDVEYFNYLPSVVPSS